jgi:DNA-directed RNA polymerase specialized sigma24 family protein
MQRNLCRAEFEKLFEEMYLELVRVLERRGQDADAVHTVYVEVMDSREYLDLDRNKKQVKEWLLGKIKYQCKVQYRTERSEFGRRRINQGD